MSEELCVICRHYGHTANAVDRPSWCRAIERTAEQGMTVESLGAVIEDWMPDGADVSVDQGVLRLVGSDLARYLFSHKADR